MSVRPTGYVFQPNAVTANRHYASVLTHTHTFSGVWHHGGALPPPENYTRLREWCKRRSIRALGMGSPYTPLNAKHYGYCEREGYDTYYSPGFDTRPMMDQDEISHMLQAVNHGQDHTLFYLDNETPKNRYAHMWWVNYHNEVPAWHDYDQPFDRWMCQQSTPTDDSDEPVPFERRPFSQVIDIQRRHGAIGVWAHPTSWWRDPEGRFITNIAAEMPAHAYADGRLDGMVIMGYHPYRPEYQALWFALLDRGYFVPGTAEMDMGLSDLKAQHNDPVKLSYVPSSKPVPTMMELCRGFVTGLLFVSSGPLIELDVDGVRPGGAAPSQPGALHQVTVTVEPCPNHPGPLGRLELVSREGQVLFSQEATPPGVYTFTLEPIPVRSYIIARVFGKNDNPHDPKGVRLHAVTNPVYLHPHGQGFNQPGNTTLTLLPGQADQFQLETASGDVLETGPLTTPATLTAPASSRVTFLRDGRTISTRYLINDNDKTMTLIRNLYRGRFLRTHPSTQPGEVPVGCWNLDAFPDAMREVTLHA